MLDLHQPQALICYNSRAMAMVIGWSNFGCSVVLITVPSIYGVAGMANQTACAFGVACAS
jgi:hypothetical protein